MDLKKVLDQTVRDLKREVNKKVLKVPEIEQKVLDATSNEPWGPHGTLMADIAQATRNYNEYQMIMAILWKRINDTGRNWRHVYKALTVLEYLVAHGSERVIDELREHSYQVSTLTDFQYVEASGKDQGINVRKKAQALVGLVNDKERIREVRQKAVANRDKYRGLSSTGGIYKSSNYSSTGGSYGGYGDQYDDDKYGSTGRYGSRDDERYGYGKDKDFDRYRDEDRYGRDGDDKYGRDGDRYSKDDRYKDDYSGEYDHEEERHGARKGDRYDKFSSREKDRDKPYDDDGRYLSRGGGDRVEDNAQDDRRADRKTLVAGMAAPPSYEEALNGADSGYQSIEEHRDGVDPTPATAQASRPLVGSQITAFSTSNTPNKSMGMDSQIDDSDDFDPRSSSGFSSGFTSPPASLPSNLSQTQLDGDLFGESAFKAEAPALSNLFSPTTGNAFIATLVAEPFANHAPLATGLGGNGFNAFAPVSTATEPITPMTFVGTDLFGGGLFNPAEMVSTGTSVVTPQSTVSNQVQQPTTVPNQVQLNVPNQVQRSSAQIATTDSFLKPQQKNKFEPKSAVWADSLSKGLIDLNISGSKINPLAELGIDLDSGKLRQERKKEERASTTSMGKAMGSGSGLGLAGASGLGPPPASMVGGMGMGMGLGMGMGTGPPMGMPPMGMGMGPAMGMPPMGMGSMGPGMGTGMGPAMGTGNTGLGMRPPMGVGPGPSIGLGMNPMLGMGMGGFPSQQQYSGYR